MTRSSGFEILDDEALETIRKIGRFPPLPPELELDRLKVELAIVFELR